MKSQYPKVLICMLTRVNAHDALNNNLLLRNLFADWPKDRLGQVYSGGDNGDLGFCGFDYCLTAADRSFGSTFFRLKNAHNRDHSEVATYSSAKENRSHGLGLLRSLVARAGKLTIESGLYELIFRLHPSRAMLQWVDDFAPDIIFAQGYGLSFAWLPVILKKHFGVPMAFYTSDDWPSYLYAGRGGIRSLIAPFMRRLVTQATQRLVSQADFPFAFNEMMASEYENRYGKHFEIIMHSDDAERFECAEAISLYSSDVKSILVTGGFNASRWPLLLDLEEACQKLQQRGLPVKATVLTSRIADEGRRRLQQCKHIVIRDDPGHNALPSYLKGADILLVSETFDAKRAAEIRYSVSTKAHLFMLAKRPIIAYGHPETGLISYAKNAGWAHVVDTRNVDSLTSAIQTLLEDSDYAGQLISSASGIYGRNHDCKVVRELFRKTLCSGE